MIDRYLVDTDTIIYWLKDIYPQINVKFNQIEDANIFTSSITIAKLYFGAYNSTKVAENLKLVNELSSEINIINYGVTASRQFGKIKAGLKRKGTIINDSDIFIASTALSNNLTLVTNNEKHFDRIENLKVQNWIK